MNKICLTVLVGIPGAGKTTFCQKFSAYLVEKSSAVGLIPICFDKFIKLDSSFDLESGCFKAKRRELLNCLEKLIEGVKFSDQECIDRVNEDLFEKFNANIPRDLDLTANEKLYAILIDDNMYYRSMRYEVFTMARKQGTGYVQMFFNVSLPEAKARNAARPNPIAEEIISRMWIKLERPNVSFYKWERNTLELLGNLGEFARLEQAIIDCGSNPEKPPEANAEKQPIEQSVVHKLDLLLRKAVGDVMKDRKKIVDDQELKLLSNHLSARKQVVLDEFRAGLLEIDPECATGEQIKLLL